MTDTALRPLLERLYRARRFGVKLELDRMRLLLDALGGPQDRLRRVIHVGGTNGKGSTAAFCEALLEAAGHRVGVFTSPHLLRLSERFRIAGREVASADLEASAVRVLDAGAPIGATFFELVTAMAFALFADAGLDAAVIEVGLGGRFDATNVLRPAVSVVTGVDFDHCEYLGDTIEAIAGEKAGIFKPGVPAVIGRSGRDEAVPLLVEAAAAAGADPVVVAEPDAVGELALGLRGAHQRANAACALRAVEQLEGPPAVSALAGRALAAARCPGRLERIAGSPDVWIDGAHNPGAAAVLAQALVEVGAANCSLVLGISSGKEVEAIVAHLAPVASKIWCTEASAERATPAGRLAETVRGACDRPVAVAATPEQALAEAAAAGRPVVVAGSLFLVGDAKRIVAGEAADPLVLTDPVG